jgi:hypothetical protein
VPKTFDPLGAYPQLRIFPDLRDSFKISQVIEAALISAKEERWLTVDIV